MAFIKLFIKNFFHRFTLANRNEDDDEEEGERKRLRADYVLDEETDVVPVPLCSSTEYDLSFLRIFISKLNGLNSVAT